MLLHSLIHTVNCLFHCVSLGIEVGNTIFCGILATGGKSAAELNIFLTCDDKESGNHERLSLRALTIVLGGLEALIGIPREAIEVETVIPVGTTNERQCMGTEVVGDMFHRNLEVLEESLLTSRLVVEGNLFGEYREITCLLEISGSTEDEPTGVVVESTTNVVVSTLGERLILMIASAIGELCRGDIDDALTGTTGHEMHKSDKVLIGVTESHTTSHSTLEERSRA